MLRLLVVASRVLLAGGVHAGSAPLSPADEAAAFEAAGYAQKGKRWRGAFGETGISSFLTSRGAAGWPEIENGVGANRVGSQRAGPEAYEQVGAAQYPFSDDALVARAKATCEPQTRH